MVARPFLLSCVCAATIAGCLIDFDGYRTGPPGTAGQGGGDIDASAGAGGSVGGSSGSGGSTGAGGAAEGGQAGAGGGQSGSGGAAQGGAGGALQGGGAGAPQGGSAGAGGAPCTFDFCAVHASTPPQGCGSCQDAVCNLSGLTYCCNSIWDFQCVVEAASLSQCSCGQSKCNATLKTPSPGACTPTGATCDPVGNTKCGSLQCELNLDSGQPQYDCQGIGPRAMCEKCDTNNHCVNGLSCVVGRCVRVCCTTSDCPDGMTCDLTVFPGTIGMCRG